MLFSECLSFSPKFQMIGWKKAAVLAAVIVAAPAAVSAQIPGFDATLAKTQEVTADYVKWTGDVVLSQPGMKFFADEVEYYPKTNRLLANGNVLLQQPDHQIAADRADFDAVTRLGTFFNARGFASLGKMADVSQFGTLSPDVQFYGETIEKIGPQAYLISHGGFTTCAQANPRWEMTSGSIKLRVDHYALLRNMLLKAKGLPVLFLPALYYPISSNARQTGFMMPSYGSSSYRGQVISNGFFWAINRSEDATVLHDWYSKTGQAISGEYRYVALHGSGNVNNTFTDEKQTTFSDSNGNDTFFPGKKSFTLNGSLSQGVGGTWFAQARSSYFSSIDVHQRSTNDLDQTSQRNRIIGGSLTGTLHGYRITSTYDRNEAFNGTTSSYVRGSAPRVTVQRPDRVISRYVPVYASITNEYVHLNQEDRNTSTDGATTIANRDIDRFDILSSLRYPFNKLSFMAINTSLQWRNTFWSDSLDPTDLTTRINNPIGRSFFEMAANVNGPSFVKIWDSPRSRFKHTIEPFLQLTHRTPIDNYSRIIKNEYVDQIPGEATSYTYGSSTRLYAKRTDAGTAAVAREIVSASIQQTYSTSALDIATAQDYRQRNALIPSHFTPVRIDLRASPTRPMNVTFRTSFDGRNKEFMSFGTDVSWNSDRVTALAGWNQVHFQDDGTGHNNESLLSNYLNTNTTYRFRQNRFGVVHSFNWDIRAKDILQQRIAGYYNAQCCGITAEWQNFDYSRLGSNALVAHDRRFHISVTLAGIGNVSNIFGALAGTPNR